MAIVKNQSEKMPAWVEKSLKKHDADIEESRKERRKMTRNIKRLDRMIEEMKKDVKYSKDLVEDHERWLRRHNLVLKEKHLL